MAITTTSQNCSAGRGSWRVAWTLSVATLVLVACTPLGASDNATLQVVSSAGISGSGRAHAMVLEGGDPAVLAGGAVFVLDGKRLREVARLPEGAQDWVGSYSALGSTVELLQPWEGAFLGTRGIPGEDAGEGDRYEVLLFRIVGDEVSVEVLCALPGLRDVALMPEGGSSAVVVCVWREDNGPGSVVSAYRIAPSAQSQECWEPQRVSAWLTISVAEEDGKSLLGMLVDTSEAYPPESDESEFRVLGSDGATRWVTGIPFRSTMIGPYRTPEKLGWLVDNTDSTGHFPREEVVFGFVTEMGLDLYDGVHAALRTGEFDARTAGDEIHIHWAEPRLDGSGQLSQRVPSVIARLEDGAVRRITELAESSWMHSVGDVNGDDIDDIVSLIPTEHPNPCGCTSSASRVAVYIGRADGTYGPSIESTRYDIVNSLDLIDLDGEGAKEIVVGYARGNNCSPTRLRVDVLRPSVGDGVLTDE